MANQCHSQGVPLPPIHTLLEGPDPTFRPQAFRPRDTRPPAFRLQDNYQPFPNFQIPTLSPLNTSFRYSTEVHYSSEEASSNDDEMIFTPGASRESSMGATLPERRDSRLSITNRATRRANRRSPPPVAPGTKVKKTLKEKLSRSNQSQVTYHGEDSMQSYTGWRRSEQSGGNGNAAGLECNKINVQRAQFAMYQKLMHDAYCENARRGTLDEWKAEMCRIADEAVDGDGSLLKGTFLESAEEPCGHADTKSKPCTTHGTPNWIPCRKEHNAHTFARNELEWRRQENIPYPEAYPGGQRQLPIHTMNTRAAAGQRAYRRHA